MSKYILWVSGPKVAVAGSQYLSGWHIDTMTDSPSELFVAKVEAENHWNEVKLTQEIDLHIEAQS